MIEVFHVVLALFSYFFGPRNVEPDAKNLQACQAISEMISPQSAVYYVGSEGYANGAHYWGLVNSQAPTCAVEPGTPRDVGKILQILGSSRAPFAIKGGGHIANPGFSSTTGVLIALARFDDIHYDSATETVEFGSGLRFNDVYNALEPYNRSIVGPRISGVGVGGFLLGGGYSWKTNQYGLAIDSIVAYELVKPDGSVVKVTEESDAELFFGLKGGFNNFGVVTRFTLKAYYQPPIWARTMYHPTSAMSDVSAATIKFSSNNKDSKANIIPTFISMNGTITILQILYYDGPTPPAGLFDDFLTIPYMLSTVHEGSLAEFITASSADALGGIRVMFHTVPLLKHSPNVVAAIINETTFWSTTLFPKLTNIGYSLEPFLPTILSHNKAPTAYPPTRDHVYFPLCIYAGWMDEAYDNVVYDAIRQSAARIRDVAIQDGQDLLNAPLYPNYAMLDTPLSDMYGENVDKLRMLRRRIDPHDVMGLTGGIRF